ncbi:MAG: thiamine diphosphokinase [Bacteroidales bacterium OttesenSCG-928-I14]|jgi:thiamine pyrophosphokinase|nr:thiamine diphosphokinase [Bacteroidales bacterium OttesenSCG-928-I14]
MTIIIPLLQKTKQVILANGSFPKHKIPLTYLKKAKKIICCNGGGQNLIEHGLNPNFIIGDMDSISNSMIEQFHFQIIKNSSQNINDLTKALNFCFIKKAWTEITIVGATGKREDHTLGNISILTKFARFMKIQLLTDYGVFVAIEKTTTFESYPGQQVSVFSLTPNINISYIDLVYPLQNQPLHYWWEGTLNEALKNNFTIEINYLHSQKKSAKILVFREYLKNKNSIDSKL